MRCIQFESVKKEMVIQEYVGASCALILKLRISDRNKGL
jgi:hypothetical protein